MTEIVLPKLKIEELELILVGITPLICHAWSEKAKKAMRDKQMKKANAGREAKDPERDFNESLYRLPDGYGFPVIAFKAAAVTACTSIADITKVQARQAFRVSGDVSTGYEGKSRFSGDLVRIGGSEPRMREDMVRVGMGTADLRYRGEFWPWFVRLTIHHNANVLSREQIANLFNTAGFGVGVGEWRSEKDGQHGAFRVGAEADLTQLSLAA